MNDNYYEPLKINKDGTFECIKKDDSADYFCKFRNSNFEIDSDDGIRYQNREEIKQIDRWIKNYLEMENIPHIDLSNIEIEKRQDYVVKMINK